MSLNKKLFVALILCVSFIFTLVNLTLIFRKDITKNLYNLKEVKNDNTQWKGEEDSKQKENLTENAMNTHQKVERRKRSAYESYFEYEDEKLTNFHKPSENRVIMQHKNHPQEQFYNDDYGDYVTSDKVKHVLSVEAREWMYKIGSWVYTIVFIAIAIFFAVLLFALYKEMKSGPYAHYEDDEE